MYTAKKQLIIVYSSLSIGWLLLMLIIFSFILSGCTKEVLGGSGLVITELRKTGDFTDVTVDGPFIVHLRESDTTAVAVSADDNLMRVIETYVSGTTLHIKLKDGVRIPFSNSMQVHLKSAVYHTITYSGNGFIDNSDTLHTDHFSYTVNGNNNSSFIVETPRLELFLNGSGHMYLRGSADNYRCEMNGSAEIDGFDMTSADAAITLKGSGKHNISVSDKLTAVIKGSGSIRYQGDPSVNSDIEGSGTLVKF